MTNDYRPTKASKGLVQDDPSFQSGSDVLATFGRACPEPFHKVRMDSTTLTRTKLKSKGPKVEGEVKILEYILRFSKCSTQPVTRFPIGTQAQTYEQKQPPQFF